MGYAEKCERIKEMLKQKKSTEEITRVMKCSTRTIQKVRNEMLRDEELASPWAIERYQLMKKFFPVEIVDPKPKRSPGKVQKGYKSGFRTPCRPDGIWR